MEKADMRGKMNKLAYAAVFFIQYTIHNHITTQLTHQRHSYTISLPPAPTYKNEKHRGHHFRLRPSKLKRLNRASLILLNVSALKLEDAKHTDSQKSHSHSFWSPSNHK